VTTWRQQSYNRTVTTVTSQTKNVRSLNDWNYGDVSRWKKIFVDMFSRFDTIPECHGQTADIRTELLDQCRAYVWECMQTRDKNLSWLDDSWRFSAHCRCFYDSYRLHDDIVVTNTKGKEVGTWPGGRCDMRRYRIFAGEMSLKICVRWADDILDIVFVWRACSRSTFDEDNARKTIFYIFVLSDLDLDLQISNLLP